MLCNKYPKLVHLPSLRSSAAECMGEALPQQWTIKRNFQYTTRYPVSENSQASDGKKLGTGESQREEGQQFEEIEANQRAKRLVRKRGDEERQIDSIQKNKQIDRRELLEAALDALEKKE